MPAPIPSASLVWEGSLRPAPAPGAWRPVSRFTVDAGSPSLSGFAERREGVTLFVAGGLDHEAIGRRVWGCLAVASPRLTRPTRQVLVVGAGSPRPGFVGLANGRGEVWLTDGEQVLGRPLADVAYLLDHELAHNAGGSDCGVPDDLIEEWVAAVVADQEHSRSLIGPGAIGSHPQIPVLLGARGVTAYATAEGMHEDWADGVALHQADARLGPLLGTAAARILTGRATALRFADCFPGRAAILDRRFPAAGRETQAALGGRTTVGV